MQNVAQLSVITHAYTIHFLLLLKHFCKENIKGSTQIFQFKKSFLMKTFSILGT